MSRRVAVAVAAVLMACGDAGAAAAAEIPNPAVEGPIEGGLMGRPWNSALEPLNGGGYDYTEREYFYSGTATNLATGATAPYKSRMLVRLPRDPKAFAGRLYVEWANVTSNYDLESRWPSSGGEFHMRRGNGIVVVSAQLVGHSSLKTWDPQRYGSLIHPGDDFSYDIFAQAIEALRDPANNGAPGVDPMGGFPAKRVAATGTSQSAGRLTTFINDGYARDRLDLFFLSRGGGPYEDFSTPIVNLNEEDNEIPHPDGPGFVGWEEAGAAHAPQAWLDYSVALAERDLLVKPPLGLVADACAPINRGTTQYTARALTHWTDLFLAGSGKLPPPAPRVERSGGAIVRDEHGLAKGGLRHPFIQVPVALNTSQNCPLFGKHVPWTNEKIKSLHPTHCDYVDKVRRWADHEVEQGWLLPADRDDAIKRAEAFKDPWPGGTLDGCGADQRGTGGTGGPGARTTKLTFRATGKRRGRVVRLTLRFRGGSPAGQKVTVRLLSGRRSVARASGRARSGELKLELRARRAVRRGRYKVQVTVGNTRLSAVALRLR